MTEKTKAVMLSRLNEICNNPVSERDVCLAIIAICMLHNLPIRERNKNMDNGKAKQLYEEITKESAPKDAIFSAEEIAFMIAIKQVNGINFKY